MYNATKRFLFVQLFLFLLILYLSVNINNYFLFFFLIIIGNFKAYFFMKNKKHKIIHKRKERRRIGKLEFFEILGFIEYDFVLREFKMWVSDILIKQNFNEYNFYEYSGNELHTLRVMSRIGIILYEKEQVVHRSAVYKLLYNYFDRKLNYMRMKDFIDKREFGLIIENHYEVDFYLEDKICDLKDPLEAFLVLLMYNYKFNDKILGDVDLNCYSFLRFVK
ncbi:hypothetical protein SLOPH_1182 [Spraguea lophii 42_110]|uniref:Uncharacterized protein n=1 Tax=Spraguea lophii (strain 42_110) TaxID=1358809 RepID=S7WAL8_SPRLO|nr:hypothetical protein SLOPH_1182 [Spraguea lophii 42_110]